MGRAETAAQTADASQRRARLRRGGNLPWSTRAEDRGGIWSLGRSFVVAGLVPCPSEEAVGTGPSRRLVGEDAGGVRRRVRRDLGIARLPRATRPELYRGHSGGWDGV